WVLSVQSPVPHTLSSTSSATSRSLAPGSGANWLTLQYLSEGGRLRRISWRQVLPALLISSLFVASFALVAPPRGYAATVSVTVNGQQRFQVIDGFGVNANPKLWNNGELVPAINELTDLGSTLWRVDIDGNSNW